MTVTFLVAINLDDVSSPTLLATGEEIFDDLVTSGYDVEAVAPWARPSTAPAQNLFGPPASDPTVGGPPPSL